MSCEQRPSVTLWGTTQVTTLTTVLSTITRPNAQRVTSSVTATTCDGDGNCGPVARPTVIVGEADLAFETITTETVVTNVIPVQTRYHPCPDATSSPPQPQSSATPESAVTSTTETADDSLTVNTVPAPSTTSSAILSLTNPASRTSSSESSLTRETSSSMLATSEHPASVSWPTAVDQTSSLLSEDPSTTTDRTGSGGAAPSRSPSSKSSSLGSNEIVGIVLGSVTALVFLGLMFLRYRSKRRERMAGEGHQETYWERRFQELEGGGEKPAEGMTPTSPPEDEGTHHKHLTMNLASLHPTINRPASRLSQISSFFGGGGGRNSPEPSRFALLRNRQAIDFSRPREDGDRFSFKSFGKAVSVKSTPSSRAPGPSGGGERRTSNWPFTGVAAAIAESIKGRPGSVRSGSIASDHQRRRTPSGTEGRKGMEWIRTIVSSDSEFGFNRDHNSNSPNNGRGLPPPPRSRGVSPLPHLSDTSIASTTDDQPRLSTFPEARPDESAPAPPMYEPRSEDQPVTASSGRQLFPSNSFRKKRQHKGLPVPDLELNRDAISPNLWIDDETLDRFGRGKLSPRRRSRDQQAITTSTAPLAISKKGKPPGPPAPSAFNPPELMSRFSPDSSRGSFSTLQQEQPHRRGSQKSGKNSQIVPATHSTPRVGGNEDPSGEPEQSRKLERSAVTPQLPTLATSSADAFRAEMAELSASTGESERVERVVSVYEIK